MLYYNTMPYIAGVFYYSLGNINPALRSTLQSIQLIAIVKSSYINLYGIDKILEAFMEDISHLEQVNIITHKPLHLK